MAEPRKIVLGHAYLGWAQADREGWSTGTGGRHMDLYAEWI